jgi:hypothetical protein
MKDIKMQAHVIIEKKILFIASFFGGAERVKADIYATLTPRKD